MDEPMAGNGCQSDGEQGWLVRPQQHQLRAVGDAAWLPGDLCRQPHDQTAVAGNGGPHRRDPQASWQHGSRGEDDVTRTTAQSTAGPCGAPLLSAMLIAANKP